MNILEIYERFPTENDCRKFFQSIRWPNGVECPKCGCDRVSELKSRKQFTCLWCRHRFSVTSGTVLHSTKLPLRKWLLAIYLLADAKKSMSSLQLGRNLNISPKRAWHLAHRIREAMAEDPAQEELFRGIVQADEYYHGGQPRPEERGMVRRGRGSDKKVPVIGVVEKSTGRIRTAHVERANRREIMSLFPEWMDLPFTELHTDQYLGYRAIGKLCKAHMKCDHTQWYVSQDGTHVNAVENAWSLLSRATMGSFHHISRKHLFRYLAEFDARFNSRHSGVEKLVKRTIRQADGRKLTMKQLTT